MKENNITREARAREGWIEEKEKDEETDEREEEDEESMEVRKKWIGKEGKAFFRLK